MSSSQIMLASWRGARLEVIQVLREVVDNVLKEHGAPDTVLLNRAKVRIHCSVVPGFHFILTFCIQGLMLIGSIFKSAVPDESDEERRELER